MVRDNGNLRQKPAANQRVFKLGRTASCPLLSPSFQVMLLICCCWTALEVHYKSTRLPEVLRMKDCQA
eukprot:1882744-Amphidinium_carterae.1